MRIVGPWSAMQRLRSLTAGKPTSPSGQFRSFETWRICGLERALSHSKADFECLAPRATGNQVIIQKTQNLDTLTRENYALIYRDDWSNISNMEMQSVNARRRGRPPKRSNEQSDTREMLLRAGVEVLTEKGFCATGIDEILRGVGIPKGSFYHYFDSKEAFGAELIDRYGAYFARKLHHHLGDPSLSPLERLKAFVSDAQSGMAKYGYKRGCLIGNLGQEMGALPASYSDRLSAVFTDWQERVARCLLSAQAAGEISQNIDCEQHAAFFWIGWEGAVLRAKLERHPAALKIFSDVFFAGLNSR